MNTKNTKVLKHWIYNVSETYSVLVLKAFGWKLLNQCKYVVSNRTLKDVEQLLLQKHKENIKMVCIILLKWKPSSRTNSLNRILIESHHDLTQTRFFSFFSYYEYTNFNCISNFVFILFSYKIFIIILYTFLLITFYSLLLGSLLISYNLMNLTASTNVIKKVQSQSAARDSVH